MTARTVTRRHFLKTAAATGAACAVPLVVSGSALGLDAEPAPSNRITMGFIGTGRQAQGANIPRLWRLATCRSWPSATWTPGASAAAKKKVEDYYAKRRPGGNYAGCALPSRTSVT